MSVSNSFNQALLKIEKYYKSGGTGIPEDASIQVLFQKTIQKEDYHNLPPEQKKALDQLYIAASKSSCSIHPEYVKALSSYKKLTTLFAHSPTSLKPPLTRYSAHVKMLPTPSDHLPDKTLESWGKDTASAAERTAYQRILNFFEKIKGMPEDITILESIDLSDLELTTLPSSFFTDPRLIDIQLHLPENTLTHYPEELIVGSVKNMNLYEKVDEIINQNNSSNPDEGLTDKESLDGSILSDDFIEKENTYHLQAADAFESEIQIQKTAQELGLHRWETSGNKQTAIETIVHCFQTRSPSLSLEGLGLSSLPSDLFVHLPFLEEFICSNNALTVLNLRKASHLKTVFADNNSIEHVSLEEAFSLEHLSINCNRLSSLDLTHQEQLQSLSASNNFLGIVDLKYQTQIIYLDLSYNTLFTIDLSSLTRLKNLKISSNFLEAIDLAKLTHLVHLNLSKNRLGSLNLDKLDHLKELISLNVSGNRLRSLDSRNLTKLLYLDLSHNQLEDFNAEGLHHLTRLNLSHNEVFLIENLSDLSDLIDLDLSDNRFLQIDLTGLVRLKTLKIGNNYLKKQPNVEVCPMLNITTFDPNPFVPKKLQHKKTTI